MYIPELLLLTAQHGNPQEKRRILLLCLPHYITDLSIFLDLKECQQQYDGDGIFYKWLKWE